ncbi:unnamed protein product [Coregonus sp. 'balchen']|nr:unnamed protein product [Coregonus sp. 'balchen']
MKGEENDDEDNFDWQIEQQVYMETSEEQLKELQKYGFGNQRSGMRAIRVYGASLLHSVSFTDDEKEQLRKFTNRSYFLDKKACVMVWLSLVDIILAYCYKVCTTEGEHNVYSSLQEVLVAFGRRVLCYPLYRHFALVSAAVQDAARIFQSVVQENEPAYLLNNLYITDHCVWIQRVKPHVQMQTAGSLMELSLVEMLPAKSHSLWKRKRLDGQLIINQWWRSELESLSICLLRCSRQGKESTERVLCVLGAAEQHCQATGKLNQSYLSQSQGDETAERHLSCGVSRDRHRESRDSQEAAVQSPDRAVATIYTVVPSGSLI